MRAIQGSQPTYISAPRPWKSPLILTDRVITKMRRWRNNGQACDAPSPKKVTRHQSPESPGRCDSVSPTVSLSFPSHSNAW